MISVYSFPSDRSSLQFQTTQNAMGRLPAAAAAYPVCGFSPSESVPPEWTLYGYSRGAVEERGVMVKEMLEYRRNLEKVTAASASTC